MLRVLPSLRGAGAWFADTRKLAIPLVWNYGLTVAPAYLLFALTPIVASLYELGVAGFVLSWELVLLGYDRRAEDSEAELPGSSVSVVKASSVAAPESNSIVGSSLRFDASQEL